MKNAIVWGATGGIGKAILKALNDDDWLTIGIARDTETLAGSADHVFEAQFDNPTSVEHVVYSLSQEVDQIDLWVYAAGDIIFEKVGELTPDDWDRILSANLSGVYNTVHYGLPLLRDGAHLIFLGAVSERLRLPGLSAYAAAKAGLEAFATAFSKEERKKRVTVARPSAVATPLWDKVPLNLPANAATPEKIAKKILEAHYDGHKGQLDLV